ncbi:unnamed protein product [Cuscuta epithymum]|uniref:Calcineurin B-like protein n=2 Tax=Cuscuta epithymum TaxID=186058 RepID=A0AAV0EL25_9ASTE|nr:unnamed protein product [Cuscuta epithymum]
MKMGCFCIRLKHRAYEDPATLSAQTHFTVKEVKALFELFSKISSSVKDDGFITKEEFQIGLFRNSKKQSFFADRMFKLFDSNNDDVIDFGEFVRALSVFHPIASLEEKSDFLFKLYDVSHVGFIEHQGVRKMIVALLHESELSLPDDIIEAIINKTFEEADTNDDGRIDAEEWKDYVSRNPSLLKNMTVPYLMDITIAFPSFKMKPETDEETRSDF